MSGFILVVCSVASLCIAPGVFAGGVFGDIVNVVIPGAGTKLDDAHRQIKETITPYKALEEGASKTVNETFVQTGAALARVDGTF